MREKQKKQTLALVIIMVICVVMTALLLTKSLECGNCGKKITGKYYVSLYDEPYCKECGKEYYRGFPGDMENVSERVNNTTRNVCVIVELIGFVVAMIFINKNKVTGNSKKDVASSVRRRIPVVNDEPIHRTAHSTEKKDDAYITKKKPVITFEEKESARTELVDNTPPISDSPKSSVLRTTFKAKAEDDNRTESSEEHKNDWFQSAGDL